jgi:hypothetical protein
MPVYYLEPKDDDTSDPRWETTILKDGCWVVAATENLARAIVQMATIKLVPIRPGQKILYSPWSEPTLADCWVDSRPEVNIPEGVIITLGGDKIPYVARLPRPPLQVALD